MELLLPLLIVFMVGMIFVSNRQRKKQAAQQESLQSALAVGDIVVMTSGISGTVVDVDDERTIDVEIAPEVVTTWLRAAVREKIGGEGVALDPDADEAATADAPGAVGATPADAAGASRTTDVPAPALEADRASAGTEHTAEGTPSARADEPTARADGPTPADGAGARADAPSDSPSTSGARRP